MERVFADAKCPECGSVRIIYDCDTGETICGFCGLVIEDLMFDQGPEWRISTFEEGEDRRRAGMPVLPSVHDKGLSTTITLIGCDAFGKRVSPSTQIQMRRLRRWQMRSRTHTSEDRNLAQAMVELDRLCSQLGTPQLIKERAAIIYRKALERGIVRGRPINAVACAALYAAYKECGVPRTAKEVASVSLVEMKDVMRCYRLIIGALNLKVPIADPVAHVSKIADAVKISGRVQSIAVELLRKAREKGASVGKSPAGLAAAALYIACKLAGEEKACSAIANAAGVSEATLRNRFKHLAGKLGLEVDV